MLLLFSSGFLPLRKFPVEYLFLSITYLVSLVVYRTAGTSITRTALFPNSSLFSSFIVKNLFSCYLCSGFYFSPPGSTFKGTPFVNIKRPLFSVWPDFLWGLRKETGMGMQEKKKELAIPELLEPATQILSLPTGCKWASISTSTNPNLQDMAGSLKCYHPCLSCSVFPWTMWADSYEHIKCGFLHFQLILQSLSPRLGCSSSFNIQRNPCDGCFE